jgi:hypothetical protein
VFDLCPVDQLNNSNTAKPQKIWRFRRLLRHREATAKGRVLEKVNKKHADLKHCLVKMGYT